MSENGAISAKAARSYREEHVNGLCQKELILMLYDGAIRFSSDARKEMDRENFLESHRLITRARNIILELLRILDMDKGGDIAKNLQRLYVYMISRLIEVNFTKEVGLLDNVLSILQNLRSAWAHIDFEEAVARASDVSATGDNKDSHPRTPPPNSADSARLLSVTA